MKYQPTFDQVVCSDLQLKIHESHLLGLMTDAKAWAKAEYRDGKDYYFLDYGVILDELPVVFKSKPPITRVVKELVGIGVVEILRVGRSNYFHVSPIIHKYWGRNNKAGGYKASIEPFQKRNDTKKEHSRSGTIIDNHSTSETITVSEVESINQLSNQSTNNQSTNIDATASPLLPALIEIGESNGLNGTSKQSAIMFLQENDNLSDLEKIKKYEKSLVAKQKPRKKSKSKALAKPRKTKTGDAWEAYRQAYVARYNIEPLRNAQVNGQLSKIIDNVGADKAPDLCRYYLTHGKSYYVQNRHAIGLLLKDCQAVYTDMMTGEQMTSQLARENDRRNAQGQIWQKVINERCN
jgi:hypothetical protein